MNRKILEQIKKRSEGGKKSFFLLIDPDKIEKNTLSTLIQQPAFNKVDFILVGGSLITGTLFHQTIQFLKSKTSKSITIFPGSNLHLDNQADGILLLSLISGRNPDFLIGQHIVAAPILKRSLLEILPTGYILVEGGKQTTVSYISNTTPIPADKPELAACTAMAGEMLGLQLIYADAGSGAQNSIPPKMVKQIRKSVDIPLLIGGGIRTAKQAQDILSAGADAIVVGTAIEDDFEKLDELVEVVESFNRLS